MIVAFPCDKSIRCSNVQLPPAKCINNAIIITIKYNSTLKKQFAPVIFFNNIINRLVSIYKTAAIEVLTQLQLEIDNNQWRIKGILKQFGSTLLPFFSCFLLRMALLIIKILGWKNHEQLENIKT